MGVIQMSVRPHATEVPTDERLSPAAREMLGYLLSHAEVSSVVSVAAERLQAVDPEDCVELAFMELERFGYLSRRTYVHVEVYPEPRGVES
jgi:hypothetical protein